MSDECYSFNHVDGVIDEVLEYTMKDPDLPEETFTSARNVVEAVLLHVRNKGAISLTPLVDTVCISAKFLIDEYNISGTGTATLRVFTDGEENFSIGVECPASCDSGGIPGNVPWDLTCRPGTCPGAFYYREQENCTLCQRELFEEYCIQQVNFFVEYFGPAGPFSPLPPDAGYFLDLADATGGGFVWNGDDGTTEIGVHGNIPPIAYPEEIATECVQAEGTPVTLHGNALDELPYSELSFTWMGPFIEGDGIIHGQSPTVTFPVGRHLVQQVVWDGYQRSAPAVTQVDIIDSTPPTVSEFRYYGPSCLWPHNHKYVVLRIGRDFHGVAEDECDPNPQLLIIGAESNQPDNARGDGDTVNDVVIFPDRICLRAERQGNERDGRLYTIYLGSSDASGNESVPNVVQVLVPHDQRSEFRCPAYEDSEIVEDSDPVCDLNATITQEGSENKSVERKSGGGCSTGAGSLTGLSFLGLLGLAVLRRMRWRN